MARQSRHERLAGQCANNRKARLPARIRFGTTREFAWMHRMERIGLISRTVQVEDISVEQRHPHGGKTAERASFINDDSPESEPVPIILIRSCSRRLSAQVVPPPRSDYARRAPSLESAGKFEYNRCLLISPDRLRIWCRRDGHFKRRKG